MRFIEALAIADARRDHRTLSDPTASEGTPAASRKSRAGESTNVARVIYARFSTELQSEKSTEDQIALCHAYAVRQGMNVIASYEDKARSGASVFGRDGLMRLMDAARDRTFDVVIVEALDRLSRDMEDLAGIDKRCPSLA